MVRDDRDSRTAAATVERPEGAANATLAAADSNELATLIVLKMDGPDAAVDARHAGLVAPLLAAPQRRRRAVPQPHLNGPTGFGWPSGREFRFPAKLALMVGTALRDRGFGVRLRPLVDRPVANWDLVDSAARDLIGDPRFAGFGGLIGTDPRIDAPRLFVQLLWLFPQSRVALAAPRDTVRAWREYLTGPHLGRPLVTRATDDRLWRGRRAVLVTTLGELDGCRPDDFDLVLVPDARPLCRRSLTESDTRFGSARWRRAYPVLRAWHVPAFGYLPPGTALSGAERLTLGSWFGRALRLPDDASEESKSVAPWSAYLPRTFASRSTDG